MGWGGGVRGERRDAPSEVAKSVACECGVEKGLNAVGDGEGWLSENVVLVIVMCTSRSAYALYRQKIAGLMREKKNEI